MTPGNNGASTPEDDDPFGYLYADGQANGAQPPGGGYGYPNSVNRVRAVGERQYGGGRSPSRPLSTGSRPSAAGRVRPAERALRGARDASRRRPRHRPAAVPEGGGRGRGPNTKGLLIGAIAVVAAVVIGIGVAMIGRRRRHEGRQGGRPAVVLGRRVRSPAQRVGLRRRERGGAADDRREGAEARTAAPPLASDVKGAKADGGIYVTQPQPGRRRRHLDRQRHPEGRQVHAVRRLRRARQGRATPRSRSTARRSPGRST